MISQNVLKQIEKLSKPGSTISYVDLNNTSDKTTISDPNNEIANAIKKGQVAEIVIAIYKNNNFKGTISTNPRGQLYIVDREGTLKDITIKITSESLSVIDTLNNKKTVLQYTKKKATAEKESLQEALIKALKKKKMTDKEVMSLVTQMAKI